VEEMLNYNEWVWEWNKYSGLPIGMPLLKDKTTFSVD